MLSYRLLIAMVVFLFPVCVSGASHGHRGDLSELTELFRAEEYDRVVERGGKDPRQMLLVAKAHERRGDYSEAIDALERLYRVSAEGRGIIGYWIGRDYERVGDVRSSLKWYRKAMKNSRSLARIDDRAAYVAVLERLSVIGPRSRAAVRIMKDRMPQDPLAHHYLGTMYQSMGRVDLAAPHIAFALAGDVCASRTLQDLVPSPEMINELGEEGVSLRELVSLYSEQGMYGEVIDISDQLSDPRDIRDVLARAYAASGQPDSALRLWREIYESTGEPSMLYLSAGLCLDIGQIDNAELYFSDYREAVDGHLPREARLIDLELKAMSGLIEDYLAAIADYIANTSRGGEGDVLVYRAFYRAFAAGDRESALSFLKGMYPSVHTPVYRTWASHILGMYVDPAYMKDARRLRTGTYHYFQAVDAADGRRQGGVGAGGEGALFMYRALNRYNQGYIQEALDDLYVLLHSGYERDKVKSRILDIFRSTELDEDELRLMAVLDDTLDSALNAYIDIGLEDDVDSLLQAVLTLDDEESRYTAHLLAARADYQRRDIYNGLSHAEYFTDYLERRYHLLLPDEILGMLYPRAYGGDIRRELRRFGLDMDPYLVMALIREESRFQTEALSIRGAVGLMQLLPSTADWILKREVSREELTRPSTNIQAGIAYLSYLSERFDTIEQVLAAYNGGPANVRRWIREGKVSPQAERFVEEIPFPETRGYVKRVLTTFRLYHEIYG